MSFRLIRPHLQKPLFAQFFSSQESLTFLKSGDVFALLKPREDEIVSRPGEEEVAPLETKLEMAEGIVRGGQEMLQIRSDIYLI